MRTRDVKQIILGFWTLWLGVIATTNLFSLLKALGIVLPRFAFASNNFALVQSFVGNRDLAILLVAAVVTWQVIAVLLFLRAFFGAENANAAFGAGMTLFAAFLIAGEVCLRFDFEAIHMRILIALIVSWSAVRLLPDA